MTFKLFHVSMHQRFGKVALALLSSLVQPIFLSPYPYVIEGSTHQKLGALIRSVCETFAAEINPRSKLFQWLFKTSPRCFWKRISVYSRKR